MSLKKEDQSCHSSSMTTPPPFTPKESFKFCNQGSKRLLKGTFDVNLIGSAQCPGTPKYHRKCKKRCRQDLKNRMKLHNLRQYSVPLKIINPVLKYLKWGDVLATRGSAFPKVEESPVAGAGFKTFESQVPLCLLKSIRIL